MENQQKNENILSCLYKEYQNTKQNNINRENNADIAENNQKQQNTIDNLNINNNDDFNKKIIEHLDKIKGECTNKFNNSINKFNTSYNEYKNNIVNYLNITKNNILKVYNGQENNEILLKFAIKKIFKKINNIIEVCDNIVNNIEKNFDLLNKVLTQKEIINSRNPLEFFLNYNYEDITNTSVFSQFHFEDIDTLNIIKNNYYKYGINYLNEEKKNRTVKVFTIKKNDINGIKNEIKQLKGNYILFKKIKILNIEFVDLQNILETFNTVQNNIDLNEITIKDFDVPKIIQEIKLNENKINIIKKLKFYKGKYLNHKILSNLFLNKADNLINLSLEKVNMTNLGWKRLINIFYNNVKVMENLQFLSLAGNSISAINKLYNKKREEPDEVDPNKDKKFKNLKVLNLSKNEIYKFEMEFDKIPNLKLLDLSSNTIPTGLTMDLMIKHLKQILALFNDNIFITNSPENNTKYIEYINSKFPTLECELKTLNLRFTYEILNQKKLEELRISPSAKFSLIKLDLSFCGFSTDIVINFLKNNYGLFSLKNLKLKYNNIKSDIFEKLLNDEISLDNLKAIDLSQNEIFCKKIEDNEFLVQTIKKFTNLERIKLKETNFYSNWITKISPNFSRDPQFTQLYSDFLNYLKSYNREFAFITDIDNSFYLEDKYRNIFKFQ